MGLLSVLLKNPAAFLLLVIPLLYSVIAHEVAHGVVAGWFGDPTAKRAGRLTLNPRPHLDPVGTLTLFLFGFGWARPVPVHYGYLKPFRTGLVCVALAGVAVNLMIAIAAARLLQIPAVQDHPLAAVTLFILLRINVILAALNLLPIPPLDGSKVLFGLMPSSIQRVLVPYERYGFFVLIVLLATGQLQFLIRFMEKIIYGMMAWM